MYMGDIAIAAENKFCFKRAYHFRLHRHPSNKNGINQKIEVFTKSHVIQCVVNHQYAHSIQMK